MTLMFAVQNGDIKCPLNDIFDNVAPIITLSVSISKLSSIDQGLTNCCCYIVLIGVEAV